MLICRSAADTGTTTRLGMVWPGLKLTDEVAGGWLSAGPPGRTETYPLAVGLTAVTFKTTADRPVPGTSPTPATCKFTVCPACKRPDPPCPVRVSINLAGVNGRKRPAVPAVVCGVEIQPSTSKRTWTLPMWLKTVTRPPAPMVATTRLGIVCPGAKFRLDAVGMAITSLG